MRVVLLAALAAAAVGIPVAGATPANPRDPLEQHSAADMRLASKIALKRTDLAAGWKADPSGNSGSDNSMCSVQPDESKLVETADVDRSFDYRDGLTSVGSEVQIFKAAADARTDWSYYRAKLFERCLAELIRKSFGQGVKLDSVSTKTLPAGKLAERTAHFRFVFGLSAGGAKQPPVVVEMVALGRGRIAAVLYTFSSGRALPAAAVDALTRVLAGRLNGSRTA